MKRLCSVSLILLVLLAPLGARSLGEALPQLSEEQLTSLQEGKMLSGRSFEGKIDHLVPTETIMCEHLLTLLEVPDSFSVVSLRYIPYNDKLDAMSVEERQVYLYNTMRAVSTQEGITYISYRAGNKPKTLIEKSWYLESPDSRSAIDDPVSTVVPPSAEYYVFQRDTTFKGNVYRHTYTTSEHEIFVEVKNLETMRVFGLVKAVGPEQMEIAMATYQLDDGLLLSAMATIVGREPEIRILGYTVDLPSAFNRRITALGNWFVDQLQK